MYAIREASPGDVHAVAALLRQYMLETYDDEWRGSVNGLLQDGFGARFRALIAVLADEAVGLLAWEKSYDLHHCLSGGHILDLYVARRHRARASRYSSSRRQRESFTARVAHSSRGEPLTVAQGLACTGGSPPPLATTIFWAGKRSAI